MSKAITLAREAGMGGDAFGWLASNHAIEKFYTLARADLEAECERRKTQFASAEFAVNELKAENAKLRDVFDELLTNIDHATSCGAWNVQAGSQTHETINAARAALGEKHD